MAELVSAKRRLNGSFGFLEINSQEWGEVHSVNISIEAMYTNVQRGMDVDKKMTGRSGSGSFKLIKAYSRSKEFVDMIKAGNEPSARLVAWVKDPDAHGGKEERVVIEDIKFTKLNPFSFTHGELVNEEFPFVFAPSNLTFSNTV